MDEDEQVLFTCKSASNLWFSIVCGKIIFLVFRGATRGTTFEGNWGWCLRRST